MADNAGVESNSPLSEAKIESLDELFSRDPLGLTDTDVTKIVTELRRQRANWLVAEASGAKRAKSQSGKVAVEPSKSTEDLMKDIGL